MKITIGQYYPVKSILHQLDPRTKIIGTLVFAISIFFLKNFWSFLPATLFLAGCILLSKVPFSYVLKGMKPVLVLLLFTVVFNVFLTPGEPLVQFWIFHITREGIRAALLTIFRLSYLILGTSLMTFTTTPNQLTDGLESLLSPLKKIKVPVHELAMMMSIALRFIPILMEETEKIRKAQMARGADFENGNLFQKMKNMIPLLVPLFVSAFRRADDLAVAMEARGYHGGEGRTKMKPLHYAPRDGAAYAVLLVYLVIALALSQNLHSLL